MRKIQKLMALSSSSNQHEAEQALIKSQQLLLKHNLDAKDIGGEEEEKIFVKRILKQKKENAKMRSIAKILENFFVSTVYKRGGDAIYLEILGSGVNLEIAEYVAVFLTHELDRLWEQAQRNFMALKGTVAKNSFFLGIARGYCNKIQSLKRGYSPEVTQGLMVIEKALLDAKSQVYKHLRASKSAGGHCRDSSMLGEQLGKQLSINPALHRAQTQVFLLESS